jgi:hypothetical protein
MVLVPTTENGEPHFMEKTTILISYSSVDDVYLLRN